MDSTAFRTRSIIRTVELAKPVLSTDRAMPF